MVPVFLVHPASYTAMHVLYSWIHYKVFQISTTFVANILQYCIHFFPRLKNVNISSENKVRCVAWKIIPLLML